MVRWTDTMEDKMDGTTTRCRTCGTRGDKCLTDTVMAGATCCHDCDHARAAFGEDIRVARHGHYDGWRYPLAGFVVVAAALLALADPATFDGRDLVAILVVVAITAWAVR